MTREHILHSYDTDLDELVNTISEMGGVAENQVAGALAALTRTGAAARRESVEPGGGERRRPGGGAQSRRRRCRCNNSVTQLPYEPGRPAPTWRPWPLRLGVHP